MRELIKKILQEQISDNSDPITSIYENIKTKIEDIFPNVDLTYKFYQNNYKGKFFINIKNEESNFKKVWNEVTEKIIDILKNTPSVILTKIPDYNQSSFLFRYSNFDFHNDIKRQFFNTKYIQGLQDLLKKYNVDYKEFIYDFDGNVSETLQKTIPQFDYLNSESFITELTTFLQNKTDIPLIIELHKSPSYYTLSLKIKLKMSLNDFLECKYKKWQFPRKFEYLYEIIRENFPLIKQDSILDVELIWPRDVGHYIAQQNKLFRDSIPDDLKERGAVKVEYELCGNEPTIFVGAKYGENLTTKEKNIFNNIRKKLFPNAKISFDSNNSYYSLDNQYKLTDKQYWTKEQLFSFFVEQSKNTFGDVYEYDINRFDDLNNLAEVYCKQHQRWFEVLPKEHIAGKRCPFDNESKGETMVRVYLEKNNIPLKQFYKLKGCFSEINGKCILLTFDFYLPEQNAVIEYDGEQHYRPVERFGGEPTYQRQVILDNIKNVFCNKSGIKMIRIPYTVKKPKDIKELLDIQLK